MSTEMLFSYSLNGISYTKINPYLVTSINVNCSIIDICEYDLGMNSGNRNLCLVVPSACLFKLNQSIFLS